MPTVTIELMDLYTGEVRACSFEFENANWTWTEGNWSCDCNRVREWNRFGPPPMITEIVCDEPRIRARCTVRGEEFDDFPSSPEVREVMAKELQQSRIEKRHVVFSVH